MSLGQTHILLEQWGRWTRTGNAPRYSSPHALIMRNNVGTVLPTPLISDDEAVVIDYLVARLNHRDSTLGQAIIGYFRDSLSYRELALRLCCGKDRAEQYTKAGIAWIDGSIDSADIDMKRKLSA